MSTAIARSFPVGEEKSMKGEICGTGKLLA